MISDDTIDRLPEMEFDPRELAAYRMMIRREVRKELDRRARDTDSPPTRDGSPARPA